MQARAAHPHSCALTPCGRPPLPQALQLSSGSLSLAQLSYGLAALQRMAAPLPGPILDELLEAATARLAQQAEGQAEGQAGPGALAPLLHASVALPADVLAARGAGASPRAVVLLLMSVARLRHVPSYAFTEALTSALWPALRASASLAQAEEPSGGGPAAAGLGTDWGAAAAELAAAGERPTEAAALSAQELASVAYGLARLHVQPEVRAQEQTSVRRDPWRGVHAPRRDSAALVGIPEMHACPGAAPSSQPEWTTALLDGCAARLTAFTPDQLASLLWALAEMGTVRGCRS